jgi:integrase
MATRKILTDVGIAAAIKRARQADNALWVTDGAIPRSHGGLTLYVHPRGRPRWYWRYTESDGRKVRLALGKYAATAELGALTLPQARAEVTRKAALYAAPDSRDVRAHLEREAKRKAAEALADEKARLAALAAKADAGKYTLEALLAVYVAHLRKQGKSSAGAVENCTLNHVTKAKPEIAQRPANAITARDVAALLRPLVEEGKGRQAGKLRAYLRAAFALAARAEVDSAVPSGFLAFGVEGNPVAATGTLAEFNRALDRALSDPELRAYHQAVKDLPDSPARDAMLLGLLLGGQRTAQVVRATTADVDVTARTLRLLDPKGKRAQPRPHILPLPDAALAVVERCIARSEAQRTRAEQAGVDVAAWPGYLFSSHGGAPLRPETVTNAATELADTLHAKPRAERVIKEPFTLRDIRRTCETHLAALGISRDTRAQILSHGLGGVQAKHYDRHDYLPEKAAALTAWAAHLDAKPAANVAPIRGRARRRG